MNERTAEYTPRPPTEQELHELSVWLSDQGPDLDDAAATVHAAYIGPGR